MPFYVGEFDATLDAKKKRLAVPSALRELVDTDEDGSDYLVMLGPDKHLWLYPDRYFRKKVAPTQENPFPTREAQALGSVFAYARIVKPDAQGRIILPDKSIARAKISDRLTLVGRGNHIEIWPADEWEGQADDDMADYGKKVLDAGDGLSASLFAKSE